MAEVANEPSPASIGRRRLLVAAGFGAVSFGAVGALPERARRLLASVEPAAVPGAPPVPPATYTYDVVLRGGRVMDPASGFDGIADVGIDGATVRAIDEGPLLGREVIDVAGRVVAPGFIDILSYDPNPFGIWFKIADGVTSNLGMHGINSEAGRFVERWSEAGSPAHFGGAFDGPWGREALGVLPDEAASADQVAELAAMARRSIEAGWIGIDVEPEYTPGAEMGEIVALAGVASEMGVPLFVHGRYSDVTPPGTNAETLAEILDAARLTGASVHVEHIVSTGGTFSMAESLDTLSAARDEGLAVTACAYPYDFWATYLGSPRFSDGWEQRFQISYGDLELPGTGERLTRRTFERARGENKLAVAYAIPEADVVTALRSDLVMIGSDSILGPEAENHPRGAGSFARTLGRYARDGADISLMDALAKMTVQPAQLLGGRVPAMQRKGRLQVGADADIAVFDPATVADRATVGDPAQESRGIDWVLVLGQVVKSPDGLRRDVLPGRPLTYGAA